MEKTRIFISYRREDTAPYAGRIYDRLVTEFGVEQVFFDIDTIPPGDDFVEVLSEKVESCDVLLAVIGKSWLTIADATGKPRIQNPEDFVAIEIGAALRRNVRVIPILVGGGRMPGTAELSGELAPLARRQAHELPDKGFVPALENLFPVLRGGSLKSRDDPQMEILDDSSLNNPSQLPPSADAQNRLATLKRIRGDWVEGVLNQSLYKVARIELGLATNYDAVEPPLNAIVQVPDRAPIEIAPGTTMIEVFERFGQSLLILGAPGTGKTTLLLELTRSLVDQAERDSNHPIPAVFNLSTWALDRKPLGSWLSSELNLRTGVPRRLAQRWVNEDKVMPLLDGLDEVDVSYRSACLEAINEFHQEHGLLPIVVCSRISEFETLGKKLQFRGAITVQPLSKDQVSDYLSGNEELFPIRSTLRADPSFSELLETPLMLWVAMLAYHHAPVEMSHAATSEQRRSLLFENFVNAMFRRRAVPVKVSQKMAIHQLTWLASSLARNKQSVFYLEDLDFDWFETRTQRIVARLVAGSCCALVSGWLFLMIIEVIVGKLSGYGLGLEEAAKSWLSIGSIFGVISVFVKLRPKDKVGFSLSHLRSRIYELGPASLWVGITFCVAFAILLDAARNSDMYIRSAIGFRPNWVVSIDFGTLAGFGYCLLQLLTAETPQSRMVANQGTRNSIVTAVLMTVLFAPLGVLLGWYLTGIMGALTLGPSIGLSAGLVSGGLFSIRHFSLRFLLWVFGGGPLRFTDFLNESAGRLLLYRVGGGYIFVHRMLLEYFTSLNDRKSAYTSFAKSAV